MTIEDQLERAAAARRAATVDLERHKAELRRLIGEAHAQGIPAARIARTTGLARTFIRSELKRGGGQLETPEDRDRRLSADDKTLSNTDQTLSESDRTLNDRDQQASDEDQAVKDPESDGEVDSA